MQFCFHSFFVRKRPEWRGIKYPFAAAGGLANKNIAAQCNFIFRPFLRQQAAAEGSQNKKEHVCTCSFVCGERGIRTPGGVTLNGFQDRRIRPLCHLSNEDAKITFFSLSAI